MNRSLPLATLLMFFSVVALPLSAGAYSLRKGKSDAVLIWNRTSLEVTINSDHLPDIGGVDDAVRASFDVWLSSGMPMKVALRGSNSPVTSGDGQHGVTWQTSEWSYDSEVVAMTVAMYNPKNALVSETDILLNARDYNWTTSPSSHPERYDVQNVVTHEVGHFFGLGHEEQEFEATMFPTTPPGETGKRSLTADDRAGIAAIIEEMNLRGGSQIMNAPAEMEQSVELQSSEPLPARGAVGCSASGAEALGSWWFLVAMLGLGLLKRRCSVLLLGLAVLVPSLAEATVVRALSLEALSQRAEIVVQARVVGQESVMLGKMIYTDHTLAVDLCLKGSCGTKVVLRTMGGEVGDKGIYVEGMPRLQKSQRIVLFARPQGEQVVALGMAQGIYQLVGKVARRDLQGLSLLRHHTLTAGAVEQVPLVEIKAALAQVRREALRP